MSRTSSTNKSDDVRDVEMRESQETLGRRETIRVAARMCWIFQMRESVGYGQQYETYDAEYG